MTKFAKYPNFRDDPDLAPLLTDAVSDDLSILCEYITDSGKGRLSLDDGVLARLNAAADTGTFDPSDRLLLAHEIQLFGGNTLLNIARGHGVVYRVVLEDVASRLKVSFSVGDPVSVIENNLLITLAARAWEKMSDGEKSDFLASAGLNSNLGVGSIALVSLIAAIQTTGFAAYKLAAVIANTVARQLLGRGLAIGSAAPLMRGMSTLAGPIGWALNVAWSAYDLTSPGYRVTVPCAIQIAYMRKKQYSALCPGCGITASISAKFCTECGTSLSLKSLR